MRNPHMGLHTDTDRTAQANGPFTVGPRVGLRTQTRTDAEWPSRDPGPFSIGDVHANPGNVHANAGNVHAVPENVYAVRKLILSPHLVT